ncbi:MAG: metal-dependent transcriptional regulator [Sulfolobales archaeon]|nr:metal-dependent transcriptional regulator [Sulfolobales archaeon]MDW8010239.1 metal-dependent transcriptional regulator [Sulfolobales archaeon]
MIGGLTPELTDYLVTIAYLVGKYGSRCCIRLVDICRVLGVAKPTASLMVGKLVDMGLVERCERGVAVSELGLRVVEAVTRRHEVLENVFLQIGVDHEKACDIARKLEVALGVSDVEAIERRVPSYLSTCDKLECRFDSAIRARKR